MRGLSVTWRAEASSAYLDGLQARGLRLEVLDGRLRIPPGHSSAEIEMVRLLKPELLRILEQSAGELDAEQAGIFGRDGHE